MQQQNYNSFNKQTEQVRRHVEILPIYLYAPTYFSMGTFIFTYIAIFVVNKGSNNNDDNNKC